MENDSGKPSPSAGEVLTAMSMTWYRMDIRRRMMRHKQAIVAALLLALPSLAAFVMPMVALFDAPGGKAALLTAVGLALVSAGWAALQRDALAFSPAMPFLASLPLSRGAVLRRDLLVLGAASAPFYLFLIVAYLLSGALQDALFKGALLVALIATFLAAQLAWTRRRPLWCAVAVALSGTAVGIHHTGVALSALVGALLVLHLLPQQRPWSTADYRLARYGLRPAGFGWIGLYARILLNYAHGSYRSTCVLVGALALVTAFFLWRSNGDGIWQIGLLGGFCVVATSVFGMGYSHIRKSRDAYAVALSALPVHAARQALAIVVAVEWPAVILSCALGVFAWPRVWMIVAIALLAGALSAMQYLLHLKSPGDAVAVSLGAGILVVWGIVEIAGRMGLA